MSNRKQSQLKRPRMKSLADRNKYFDELKRDRQAQATVTTISQSQADDEPKPLKRKPGRPGAWDDFELLHEFSSVDLIARPLVEHGWSAEVAISFANRVILTRHQYPDIRFCPCGAKATVASEKSGPRCATCLLELDCNVVQSDEPKLASFGQRRVGTQLGDPSPWLENAVRCTEGD